MYFADIDIKLSTTDNVLKYPQATITIHIYFFVFYIHVLTTLQTFKFDRKGNSSINILFLLSYCLHISYRIFRNYMNIKAHYNIINIDKY